MSQDFEQKTRILVADDEGIVVSLISDALEDEGFEVETVSSGQDGLEALKRNQFDLIISDIRMPGMSGIDMVARAREMQPGIGVIFMTGYADLNSAKNAIKQGAFDYIMKPFELAEMRQAVRNAIRTRREAEEQSSDRQLTHLSDLNQMLFSSGDRRSLITSSLKFAMMHMHAQKGSALFWDSDENVYVLVTVADDKVSEVNLPRQPLGEIMHTVDPQQFREPFVVTELEDHPVYRQHPKPELKEYLFPDWYRQGEMMIVVPVCRVESICGAMMIKFDDDTVRLKEADTKFLSITASQLAITLENLSLLEETQKAYSRLKELQDETIELEKMATRGQLSAEIGHELNNFLGVVAGNLSLLDVNLKKGRVDQLERHVVAMTDTITKMKSFTANLMDLTPISSTKELLYFDKIIREVVEYLKPQKRYRDISIKIDRLANDVPFEADGTQIQQLLYNLFNNAADATKGSDRREIIVSVAKPSDGSTFTVTIKDTGEGIEPSLLEKAFKEKFTTKKSGHGFGLIVCNRIIENHGGRLRIDSTPGQGTAISIDFPLRMAELVPA